MHAQLLLVFRTKRRANFRPLRWNCGQVVADEIAVVPSGQATEVKAVNDDLDQGIGKNLDAILIQNKMHDSVNYKVKNGVITLSGQVDSEEMRRNAQNLATSVPKVQQVVNDLQIKNLKASSSQPGASQ